ncbi:hypothetical protein Y032_0867g2773 [Ancylostoma ceylanicum]|uniref:Uncharacterized protein n=1 Tax=Ancylostoma ceylanicum TaxID=53326 RepID=A0A016WAM4_9BILA|nr:hypothetical protein Y032_0867g2773 [Ancylostoma ceylanicum]
MPLRAAFRLIKRFRDLCRNEHTDNDTREMSLNHSTPCILEGVRRGFRISQPAVRNDWCLVRNEPSLPCCF